MATSSQTKEYCTFQVHYAKLVDAIQDPLHLAAQLFSRSIITSAVKDRMNVSALARMEKNSELLSAVEAKIRTDQSTFRVFLSALKEDHTLLSLVESMESTCFIY